MRKPSILVVLLTVFIDLVGFGIIVPLIPVYSRHFGVDGYKIGLIFAAYSAMQFIFAPIWGRWSDRFGRRPMLLISTAGSAASYALFARASGLENLMLAIWLIVASRIFAGICGGNITVAQAYIADISPPEIRSKRMGLIGMAFGLGFIFGPIIGGLSLKYLGGTGPGWVAAALCAFNFILALIILVESRQAGSGEATQRPHLAQWRHTLTQPKIGPLVIVFFLATFCFSCFEVTLPLIVSDNFHLDIKSDETMATTVTYLFAYCSIISAFVQGGAIGRLVKKHGEPKLIAWSLVITAVSMAAIPFIKGSTPLSWGILIQSQGISWLVMLAVLAVLSLGTALTRPPLFGLLSNLTHADEQGANIGVAQGAGSLARILGPVFATGLLPILPALPYLACAGILIATTFLVTRSFPANKSAATGSTQE